MTHKTMPLRTDGFVRNIYSRNQFDVIRADVVFSRLEKQANHSCGMHYEIYEYHLLSSAFEYLEALPLEDRPQFMGIAAQRGYLLTAAAVALAEKTFMNKLCY